MALTTLRDAGGCLVDDDSFRRVACARVYGMPAGAVKDALRASYPIPHDAHDALAPGHEYECAPLSALVWMAEQKPSFVMDPPCPGS